MQLADLGGPELKNLCDRAIAGDLRPATEWMFAARHVRDWDEAGLVATVVGERMGREPPAPTRSVYDAHILVAPTSAELHILRAVHAMESAWDARGGGPASTVAPAGADAMDHWLALAHADLSEASRLDPYSPIPPAIGAELCMMQKGQNRAGALAAVRSARERHPANHLACRNGLRVTGKKWGGTHADQLAFARTGVRSAYDNPDRYGDVFVAHIEAWFYEIMNKQHDAAAAYLARRDVGHELEQAFDAWVTPTYRPRRISPLQLHLAAGWFFLVKDRPRLMRAAKVIGSVFCEYPWVYVVQDGKQTWSRVMEWQVYPDLLDFG